MEDRIRREFKIALNSGIEFGILYDKQEFTKVNRKHSRARSHQLIKFNSV